MRPYMGFIVGIGLARVARLLSTGPEQEAVDRLLHDRWNGPGTPEVAVDPALDRRGVAFAGQLGRAGVQRGVLVAQHPEQPAVLAARAEDHRLAVAAVAEGDLVELHPAPALLHRSEPEVP